MDCLHRASFPSSLFPQEMNLCISKKLSRTGSMNSFSKSTHTSITTKIHLCCNK
ncbi:hypothetical protein J008_00001 [Cryptococcus neoformans]|nr:hypothetical protein C346_05653 [Cryptococcus neoformans var. grubii D17-1]OXH05337.1 hypothetical protein C370_05916 [Cryptococcus neoformans var. grubii A1-35-8]OXH42680.1 hypothetical protein J008_00001 [Cryptococcus neoformans var. grubii]OXH45148.1 hypothetical protein J004_05701 [Cryptococcus neoformans var. grubii]